MFQIEPTFSIVDTLIREIICDVWKQKNTVKGNIKLNKGYNCDFYAS